jgi:hypothetical protein
MDRNSRSRENGRVFSPSKSTRNGRPKDEDGRTPDNQLRPLPALLDRQGNYLRPSPMMLDRDGRRFQTRPSPVMVDTDSRKSRHRHHGLCGREGCTSNGTFCGRGRDERSSQMNMRNPGRNQTGTLPASSERSRAAAAAAPSVLHSTHDQEMASRQIHIDNLLPVERQKQEAWVQIQIQQMGGPCAAGYDWYRVQGGYRCNGGRHMVTDELLAEGKGGCYSSDGISGRMNPNWK